MLYNETVSQKKDEMEPNGPLGSRLCKLDQKGHILESSWGKPVKGMFVKYWKLLDIMSWSFIFIIFFFSAAAAYKF